MMILCLGTTPAVQRIMVFRRLELDAVNRAVSTADGPAGKAVNMAKVLRVLGAHPVVTGFLGGDRGEFVAAALAAQGIELDCVRVTARTRECVTVIDESGGTHTELVEEGGPVSPAEAENLLAVLRRRIPGSRAVVMSGTIAPCAPPDLYFHCTQLAETAGAISIVDAQGPALLASLAARPTLVKPNRAELAAALRRQLNDEAAVKSAMSELSERGAHAVVVTAGREPTLAFDGSRFWKIIGPQVTPINPIGSGDSFTAGLAWRLTKGDDLGSACRWGSACGAANALTLMPGQVNLPDVQRLAQQVVIQPV